MSTSTDPAFQAARAARRRRRQSRQAIVFGTLIVFLASSALVGTLIATGTIASPFKQDFTAVAEDDKPPEPWCPQGDMMPVPYNQITATVLNGTKIGALASRVSNELIERGFNAPNPANGPVDSKIRRTAEIHYGPSMANQALTLAANIEGAVLFPDNRETDDIEIIARKLYGGLVPADQVNLVMDQPLKAPALCRTPQEAPPTEETPATDPVEGDPGEGDPLTDD